jgi:hypothetical protein
VAYIDSDQQAIRFFQSGALEAFVKERKEYPEEPEILFQGVDYRNLLEEYRARFDLLISQ